MRIVQQSIIIYFTFIIKILVKILHFSSSELILLIVKTI